MQQKFCRRHTKSQFTPLRQLLATFSVNYHHGFMEDYTTVGDLNLKLGNANAGSSYSNNPASIGLLLVIVAVDVVNKLIILYYTDF